jgi:hypothetical protein
VGVPAACPSTDSNFDTVGGETRLQSRDYDGADDRYDIEVLGGASNFTIEAG